jgi:beta-galactosidase GanA
MQAPSPSAMNAEVPRIQRARLKAFEVLSLSSTASRKLTAKMVLFTSVLFVFLSFLAVQASGLIIGRNPRAVIVSSEKALLQDLVTWDDKSLFVRGERILFYSGEFHPFRLPVPGLWLDVFQKIKALGYSGVSFYVDWALVEGTPGVFSAEGIFDLDPFFAAASEAGIYLLARPGPYINAEVSGGGFPGWLQRIKGHLRTPAADYLNATNLYVQSIGEIVAKAQITNGGPVILLQPENEYTQAAPGILFPNGAYFAYVEQQYRNAGIVVPFISNDASPKGIFAPGNGTGSVDIYGHDSYPLGFDCANPYTWPNGSLPTNYHTLHLEEAPTGPYAIVEFQGGSFDPWGGSGFGKCTTLLNQEFERVFYKNDFSFGVTIFNIYMTYGGTNWGNLGHPGGYTSYDYGAVIAEDLTVSREKYSEAKLEVNFLMASPAYLTATPGNGSNGSYVDTSAIEVTQLFGNGTNFYVARHAAYNSLASTSYKLTVPVSGANVTIPQLTDFSTSLTLNGRDSKIHVTDYDLGGINLLYSSAEIFTWAKYPAGRVLVLYGGADETHEFALPSSIGSPTVQGGNVAVHQTGSATIIQWQVMPDRRIVSFEGLTVYLLWRNDAYNYWVLDLPAAAPINNFTSSSKTKVIAKAGYLLRTATVSGNSLYITGDLNATTTLEIIGGLPAKDSSVYFNNQPVSIIDSWYGAVAAVVPFKAPMVSLPSLPSLTWKYIDSLPEIQPSYDDAAWTACSLTTSNNPRNLTTPTSLYAADYGYHTGSLIYRGDFTATGNESSLFLETQGGLAFGHSIWLDNTFVSSWAGIDKDQNYNATYNLPVFSGGTNHVLTLLIDHMGLDEEGEAGGDAGNNSVGYEMKNPRGILRYQLANRPQDAITWKVTGNLGGEQYADKTRGPLNEGALFAERQGYHLPAPPTSSWATGSPLAGISTAGVRFYSTSFELAMPMGYDIPLSFVFNNGTTGSANVSNYRSMLFVNGYQYGKYVHNIGPQDSFPVPEGILNYNGMNWIAISLWALDGTGAQIEGLELVAGEVVQSARGQVAKSPMTAWEQRVGAY